MRSRRYQQVFWRRPIFPGGSPPSIVGADSFHDRVRDGNGWDAIAKATRNRCLFHVREERNCVFGRPGAGESGRASLAARLPLRAPVISSYFANGVISELCLSFLLLLRDQPLLERLFASLPARCFILAPGCAFSDVLEEGGDACRVNTLKVLGHLVRVSSIHHCTSTPRLSTR